jgi:hypothetical protein
MGSLLLGMIGTTFFRNREVPISLVGPLASLFQIADVARPKMLAYCLARLLARVCFEGTAAWAAMVSSALRLG